VEAASVAWEPLGWQPVWYSEIEPFPSAVLAHRFPTVPNLGDMTKIHKEDYFNEQPIDLLVGGTPCQSFSVAGLRKGMADPRGNLALVYLALAHRKRPRWIVWENVPGVLSSEGGRDFGAFLGGLGECGYGFAYRVLDAQYFGVAQRRRRVFVVGHLGDWRPAAAVLFEPHSMQGHPAPRRETREAVAGYTAGSFGGYREGVGTIRAQGGDYGGGTETLVAPTLNARTKGGGGLGTDAELGGALVPAVAWALQHRDNKGPDSDTKEGHLIPVAYGIRTANTSSNGWGVQEEGTHTLDGSGPQTVGYANAVRRLTPRECERLQGFPDDWTLVPYRSKPATDGPRYKAMGNSMAVPVMAWLGNRIEKYERGEL
jgi:DNA (cytosine-5)-methyltransferase 1